jgi:hypothetical protein
MSGLGINLGQLAEAEQLTILHTLDVETSFSRQMAATRCARHLCKGMMT